ncbi:hypothetical protein ACLOJK_010450 [Asimina triloba]
MHKTENLSCLELPQTEDNLYPSAPISLTPQNSEMSSNDPFFSTDIDHHDRKSDGVNGRVMLTAVISLFFVVVVVLILHIYARWALRRQARRRAIIHQLNMGIAALQTQAQEPPKTGLEPSAIAALPLFAFKQSPNHRDCGGVECTVCLTAIEEGEMARLLPNCKHMFHVQCIDMWLHSHSTCPVCRAGAEAAAAVDVGGACASAPPLPPPPPLDSMSRSASWMGLEGSSDNAGQSSKVVGGGSSSRISSFRKMLSRDRSERRVQPCGTAEAAEDLERQS